MTPVLQWEKLSATEQAGPLKRAPSLVQLAQAEGLDAHAAAVTIRGVG
jgi:hypothetical protein